eukprot:CAMPEP_0118970778 /NCGR_PEP_ID=MMETSP1173-20130426/7596_1 /TAXON_ID=1034831 /ORGANISM="Rhizochromulina marina cf, Strain CCMP1243" /LENGTH=39 /DNA_ID= /DNA_START= /DNA_END= /DNA_ORIENTATION=
MTRVFRSSFWLTSRDKALNSETVMPSDLMIELTVETWLE